MTVTVGPPMLLRHSIETMLGERRLFISAGLMRIEIAIPKVVDCTPSSSHNESSGREIMPLLQG